MNQSDIIALAIVTGTCLALVVFFVGWHRKDPQTSRQFWHDVLSLPERKLTEWAERVKRR